MKHNRGTLTLAGVMPKLTPLAEHNAKAAEAYRKLGEPCLNGIACPSCGSELMDTNPSITLTSSPAQKHINCSSCAYTGTRLT